jgi:hypothetical protein
MFVACSRGLLDGRPVIKDFGRRSGLLPAQSGRIEIAVEASHDGEHDDQQPTHGRHGARTLRKYRYRSTAAPRASVPNTSMM